MNNLQQFENSDSKLLNWKRISVIMLSLTLVSILSSQGPEIYYGYKIKKAIQKASSQCPIEIADAFRLDSIKIIQSKEVRLYLTDELGQVALKDTARLKAIFAERTKSFSTNPEFQYLLRQGYVIGFDLKDYLQNQVFKIKMDPAAIIQNSGE